MCRVELGHLEPSACFSAAESQEFLKVSQLMEMRCRAHAKETGNSLNLRVHPPATSSGLAEGGGGAGGGGGGATEAAPPRRMYRVWTAWERYTVSLGIATYGGTKGAKVNKIRSLLDGRSESQVGADGLHMCAAAV